MAGGTINDTQKHHPLQNQHNTTFFDAGRKAVLTPAAVCRKSGSSRLQIVLATNLVQWSSLPSSSLLHEVPCHSSIPRSFHSLVPSLDPIAFWLRGLAICRNNVWRTKSLNLLLKMMLKSYAQQKRSSLKYHPVYKGTSPRSNACRPPRNGQPRRRPEQPPNQTPEFAMI